MHSFFPLNFITSIWLLLQLECHRNIQIQVWLWLARAQQFISQVWGIFFNYHRIIKGDIQQFMVTISYKILSLKTNGVMPHLHNCYFHDHSTITHFCAKPECTLPMCDKCLPIHLQEHSASSKNEGIISFQQAEERATSGLKKLLAGESSTKATYINRMQEVKAKFIQIVDSFISEFKTKIDEECACISEIEKKLTKIQKGSLKTLIYFYTEQEKLINKETLDTKLSQLERVQKSFARIIEQQKNPTIVPQHRPQSGSTYQETKKIVISEQQGRQRGYSMNLLNTKTENERSTSQTKFEKIDKIQSVQNNKFLYNQPMPRIRTDASFKVLPKTYTQHQQTYANLNSKGHLFTEENNYRPPIKIDTESDRQRQIENIRRREEQKKREKQEKERKNKLEMEREKQNDREKQLALLRMNQKIELQKNRIDEHNEKQSTRVAERTGHSYQFMEYQKTSTANYQQVKKDNSIYIQNEAEIVRKPLQVSDLNIETKYSMYGKAGMDSKDCDKSLKINEMGFNLNKEVLSPEQIRKMLEKRIEQRSRLISKNKSVSLLRNTEQSISKSINKSKELVSNNYAGESEGRWDTKDSIINQIYEDYRY